MKLVVGLGNPGRKYASTRHNVGFDVVAELARRFSAPSAKVRFEGDWTEIDVGGVRVALLAPRTYMNLSGRSVQQATAFYKIPLDDVLVVCDDMNLPTGKLRMRKSGSAGGQKGLQNILDQAGSTLVPRLRIGVDRPPGSMDSTDHVLGKFGGRERELVDAAVFAACDAVEWWATSGIEFAMNRTNAAASQGTD